MSVTINQANNNQYSYSSVQTGSIVKNQCEKEKQKEADEKKQPKVDEYIASDSNSNLGIYTKLGGLKDMYVSYNGKRTSFYDLLKEASDKGIIDLKDEHSVGYYTEQSFSELILKNSKAIYEGSTTLYSQDEKYIINKGVDGHIDGFQRAVTSKGVHVKEIAEKLAGGTAIKDMDSTELEFLRIVDPELFQKAYKVNEVRVSSQQYADMYSTGQITKKQCYEECTSLYKLLTGKDSLDDEEAPALLSKLFEQPSSDLIQMMFSSK